MINREKLKWSQDVLLIFWVRSDCNILCIVYTYLYKLNVQAFKYYQTVYHQCVSIMANFLHELNFGKSLSWWYTDYGLLKIHSFFIIFFFVVKNYLMTDRPKTSGFRGEDACKTIFRWNTKLFNNSKLFLLESSFYIFLGVCSKRQF